MNDEIFVAMQCNEETFDVMQSYDKRMLFDLFRLRHVFEDMF